LTRLTRKEDRRRRVLEEAWIGDAVLCLYARRVILRAAGAVDGERLQTMTSNRFLARFGEPSEVEAEIGRIYERDGLEAAFAWIEQTMGAAHAKALDAGTSHPRT
jgi:hypothetical protein